MSATPPDQAERTVEVTHFLETTEDQGWGRYGLVRFYRRGDDTFRVRFFRHDEREQSVAIAHLLTTTPRDWLRITENAPSNWHDSTFRWGDRTKPRLDVEAGLARLRELADALAADAALVVPA